MGGTEFNLLDVPVANFQSFSGCDSTAHTVCCTDNQSFHNTERSNDFVLFCVDTPLTGDIADLRPAQLVRIPLLLDGPQTRCLVLLQELQLENQGLCLSSNGLLRVSDNGFSRNQADHAVVNIKCVRAGTNLICIPRTRYYYVNNTINLVMYNHFWPKPPDAEGDMQTDNDAARSEKYHRNRFASVDEDEQDEEVDKE
jgi:hypothetical protein